MIRYKVADTSIYSFHQFIFCFNTSVGTLSLFTVIIWVTTLDPILIHAFLLHYLHLLLYNLLVTLMVACNTILAVLNGVIQHGNDCSILRI